MISEDVVAKRKVIVSPNLHAKCKIDQLSSESENTSKNLSLTRPSEIKIAAKKDLMKKQLEVANASVSRMRLEIESLRDDLETERDVVKQQREQIDNLTTTHSILKDDFDNQMTSAKRDFEKQLKSANETIEVSGDLCGNFPSDSLHC